MILQPLLDFFHVVMGEQLFLDPLLGPSLEIILVLLTVLFVAFVAMMPFGLLVKIIRRSIKIKNAKKV